MNYGLSEEILAQMTAVFSQYAEISRVVLFGSRAKNTHRTGSDVDLALVGDTLSFRRLLSISAQLEDLGTLYTFDVIDMNRLKNDALRDHINRVGVVVYQAEHEYQP